MPLVAGKVVLDIASGEGYGSALMADAAERVIGVDISQATVEYASQRYYRQNLAFLVGSCDKIPLPDSSVEVVTSFETIEHHDKHQEMLQEIKRVLKPDGMLIISSPNRLTYSDEPNYSNPFHVKELYFHEFNSLLAGYFKHVVMYGQRLATASFVYSLNPSEQKQISTFQGGAERLVQRAPCLRSPIYFVSICSDDPAVSQLSSDSIYIDPSDDLLKNDQLSEANKELALRAEELTKVREQYDAQIRRDSLELSEVRSGYETQIKRLQDELAHDRSTYDAQITGFETQISEALDALAHSRRMVSDYEAASNALIARHESEIKDIRAVYEARTEELQARLNEQDGCLTAVRAQLSATRSELATAQAQLRKSEEILLWIETSRAWRWSSQFRRLFDSRGARWMRRGLYSSQRNGLYSCLDFPSDGAQVIGPLRIDGWAFGRKRITRVEAFLDDFYLGNLTYGVKRLDVLNAYPTLAHAACGFSDLIALRGEFAGERKLLVRIYDEDGSLQLYVRSITIQPAEMRDTSLPPSAKTEIEEDYNAVQQPVAAPNEVDEFLPEFRELLEEFKRRIGREPAILQLGKNLNLAPAFPGVAIFSPVSRNSDTRLPYLDHSIDLVLVSSEEAPVVDEARRLAAVAVVRVLPAHAERSNGSGPFKSSRLSVEWRQHTEDHVSGLTVSIIIPVYNNSRYTAKCLQQLRDTVPDDLCDEIIVVDDASTDDTQNLLAQWRAEDNRLKVVRNESNLGFIHSCNRGAEAATRDVLVFLNNDTIPQPGWLPPLVQVLREQPKAGAVGGKLLYPDGSLQEAGGIIFNDGTGCNFGRNSKFANSPLFNFLRQVDYCSGALLATPRELFLSLGGFDVHFAPAYYEDTDYCFRLREHGFVVYYQPESVIIHLEGISSGTSVTEGVKRYQEVNRSKFIERWKEALRRQPTAPAQYDFATWQLLSIRER